MSRKLEAQTQRLELLTAQSMANEHISARQPDSHDMRDNIPYADEGDEVPFVPVYSNILEILMMITKQKLDYYLLSTKLSIFSVVIKGAFLLAKN